MKTDRIKKEKEESTDTESLMFSFGSYETSHRDARKIFQFITLPPIITEHKDKQVEKSFTLKLTF